MSSSPPKQQQPPLPSRPCPPWRRRQSPSSCWQRRRRRRALLLRQRPLPSPRRLRSHPCPPWHRPPSLRRCWPRRSNRERQRPRSPQRRLWRPPRSRLCPRQPQRWRPRLGLMHSSPAHPLPLLLAAPQRLALQHSPPLHRLLLLRNLLLQRCLGSGQPAAAAPRLAFRRRQQAPQQLWGQLRQQAARAKARPSALPLSASGGRRRPLLQAALAARLAPLLCWAAALRRWHRRLLDSALQQVPLLPARRRQRLSGLAQQQAPLPAARRRHRHSGLAQQQAPLPAAAAAAAARVPCSERLERLLPPWVQPAALPPSARRLGHPPPSPRRCALPTCGLT